MRCGLASIMCTYRRLRSCLWCGRCPHPTTLAALRWIYETKGITGLWRGTSAGIMKTVPKYCTAIVVKDSMEGWLEPTPQGAPR